MKTKFYEASSRGYAKHDWLESFHTFSFADYYDVSRMEFGALRVLNDDFIKGGKGFGMHPHRNMEIISIVLAGTLEHKDSMGNTQVIGEGEIQLMSAGSGVYHQEINPNPKEEVNIFQIWIFPNEQLTKPSFTKLAYDKESKNKLVQIASPPSDIEGLNIRQNAWLNIATFDKDYELSYNLHRDGYGVFAMVIEGEFLIGKQLLQKRDALGIWDIDKLDITAKSANSKLLLIEVPMVSQR